MQHDIVKLCADSLRAYLKDKHDIKLKSGHAHEIVAAFLGYKTAVSLRQDKLYPIANLEHATYVLFDPATPFVNPRLETLNDLPPDLPPDYILAEGVYPPIFAQKWILEKIKPVLNDLGVSLAKEHVRDRMKKLGVDHSAMQWMIDTTDIDRQDDGIFLTVTANYIANGELVRDSKMVIKLPRVAGRIGYGKAQVTETRYSGKFRDPEFNPSLVANGIS